MKRVLTITPYPIGDISSLGITMEKFFHDYDENRIFQIYMKEINPNRKHLQYEYQFDDVWYLHKNRKKTNAAELSSSASVQASYGFIYRLKTSLKDRLPVMIPAELDNMLLSFRPDAVYVQLYSIRMARFALKIQKKYQVSLAVHFLDDWIEAGKYHHISGYLYEKTAKRKIRNLMGKTERAFGTSPFMCKYMKREYGKDADFVMPYTDFPLKCPDYHKHDGCLSLSYTGNIEGGRHKTIKRFVKAMDEANVDFRLDIYTRQGRFLSDYHNEHLSVHDAVPQSEVSKILDDSDGLIHVESFNPDDIKRARYSLSTKIPEYLASGRPVFYLGPKEAGTGNFLNGGYAECAEEERVLAARLKAFYEKNEEEIQDIVNKRFIKAKELLSAESMGKLFSGWYI